MSLDLEGNYNFSWIEENMLAGSSFPSSIDHFNFFRKKGIRVIINLTDDDSYNINKGNINDFIIHHIHVQDFAAPSIDQINKFLSIVSQYKRKSYPIVVHCSAGCGRTGTFLAAYLITQNLQYPVKKILSNLRKLRPCSVETTSQTNVLHEFYYLLTKSHKNNALNN